jgi:hypothetical protein
VALFVVEHETARSAQATWARVTDWQRHARYVPLTSTTVRPAPEGDGVGTLFTARTALGPVGFDDPMQVVEWQPPVDGGAGRCRLEKRGSVMTGWAELTVTPTARGSRAVWREDIRVGRLPRFTDPVTRLSSRLLFGRVLRRLIEDD